ncbi:Hsp70 family protein [Pendulispora brunnea]|uniref:Hsp70 family protein n=1 Tax=Pendulispora brunnea TaxID=2905690 RepID=A0ABZ2KK89_9BACT
MPSLSRSCKLWPELFLRHILMTANSSLYLGIDLGTTNSTAAVFDGVQVTPVRNAQGGVLTPSVVRIDGRGTVTVGARARRFLESDPENTRAEFKRLMGTQHRLTFAAAGVTKRPEELAAEVLQSIRADVRDQFGFAPDTAVISVPALFELAQTQATSEAARLAGFRRVEMIQEPVASAIAAGWSAEEGDENWLVYDLGGGTFDVTLLATKDGLLRVVGHDGDNFLGGRDFDTRIVDWVLAELKRSRGITIDLADAAHGTALRKLRHAAEEAKIELARTSIADIVLPALFVVNGDTIDIDVQLPRDILEERTAPLVDRSIAVCRRLLAAHGAPRLGRIVLVGGPTVMPLLRARVAESLGAPFRDGLDPMTLVAQGAALFARTAQLEAKAPDAPAAGDRPRVWLQFPAMTPDLAPFVVGKLLEEVESTAWRVILRRADGKWTSAPEPVDVEGVFAIQTQLASRRPNVFRVEAMTASGELVALQPSSFAIVHGVTISDPPLSRSIGVALASDRVQLYFERGSPLPMRRTFALHTVEVVSRGLEGFALNVPIVQGEFPFAHLCRLVGTLEIPSADIKATLPAGSLVELTLDLDRGGRLSATARVPALEQTFDHVAHLIAPHVSVEELAERATALRTRGREVTSDAMKRGMGAKAIATLGELDAVFAELASDIERARGGDADAAEKARRMLLEIDASLADLDVELSWPMLEESVRESVAWALGWSARYATPDERKALQTTLSAIEKAAAARDVRETERHLATALHLGSAAFYRHPAAWEWQFESVASRIADSTDLPRASTLVREGRRALAENDRTALERIVRQLRTLLPADATSRRLGFSSGVR